METMNSNIPNLILMVRPKSFGYNHQTAETNSFQLKVDSTDVSNLAIEEFNQMLKLLEDEKITVKVFEDLEVGLPDSVFPNNWVSQIPEKGLVIYAMNAPNRRQEIRTDIIDWIKDELHVKDIDDLSPNAEKGLFLEGTGSIIFDHLGKLAYACVSPRTDLSLLNALCKKNGYNAISFESLDVEGRQIYHTNVMMSIASNIVLICSESIQNLVQRAMVLESFKVSGKKVIELSYTQMNNFAANALEVQNAKGELYFVFSKTAIESLNESQIKLIQQTHKILAIPIPIIEKIGGGSVRCMMCGLFDYPR